MAGHLNRASLVGNVGADPEIRNTTNGKKCANLYIATSESWTDKTSGEKREKTEWHRIVCWNEGLIGVIERFVHSGSRVMIEGKIQTRKWQDQSGADRYSTEIVMDGCDGKLLLLGDPNGKTREEVENRPAARTSSQTPKSAPKQDYDSFDDEIPF